MHVLRSILLLWAYATKVCVADISRAKTADIFNVHETCDSRLEHHLDQTSMLLEKCISKMEMLRGGPKGTTPPDKTKRETRNVMLAAHNAFGVVHPMSRRYRTTGYSDADGAVLTEAAGHLDDMHDYLNVKRGKVANDKDYIVCHEKAYREVTIAFLVDESKATVLTVRGAGMVRNTML